MQTTLPRPTQIAGAPKGIAITHKNGSCGFVHAMLPALVRDEGGSLRPQQVAVDNLWGDASWTTLQGWGWMDGDAVEISNVVVPLAVVAQARQQGLDVPLPGE